MTAETARRVRQRTSLEALLRWTYREQGVLSGGMLGGDRERRWLGGRDSLQGFVQLEQLGTRVSSSGGGGYAVHPDADTVHTAVVRQIPAHGRYIVNVVVWHAFAGDRPEWGQYLRPRFEPVWRERAGRRLPALVWDKGQLRDHLPNGEPVHGARLAWRAPETCAKKAPLLCPVALYDDPRQVIAQRHEYRLWRACLFDLAVALLADDQLTRFALDGRLPPEAPWRAPAEAADAGRRAQGAPANENFFRKNA